MYLFVLLAPGLLDIFFFESNADKVERMHDKLDDQIRNLTNIYEMENNIQENTDENNYITIDSGIKGICIVT
jgi:hypothetical protein